MGMLQSADRGNSVSEVDYEDLTEIYNPFTKYAESVIDDDWLGYVQNMEDISELHVETPDSFDDL